MSVVTSCNMQGVTSDIPVKQDGTRQVYITMEGGSGKAHIESPVTVTAKDGQMLATLVWSSKNYDYVLVDGVKYVNENPGGNSTFTVPIRNLDEPFTFTGDTVAMSTPHEIEYTIIWDTGPWADTGAQDDQNIPGNAGFGSRPSDYKEPVIPGYEKTGEVPVSYAQGFSIKEYEDLKLISIYGVGEYLVVPEDANVPENLPDGITVLKKPLDKTYLVSTSVMDLLRAVGALSNVTLSGKRAEDWYISEAADLMSAGKMEYAGKYRTPDYELILSKGCNLAIENTMIYHDPEVKEKLEELGIPVLVETSSYESDPLGRLEWIKLYGVLYDRANEAEKLFDEESGKIEKAAKEDTPQKSVAMFYVSATGLVNVRSDHDYVAKMIGMAGGRYVPSSGREESDSASTIAMQMEDFYVSAKDADILIYNSTIDKEIQSLDELTAKNAMFADFKAVKEQNVYCLKRDFFQRTMSMSVFIEEIRDIIAGGDKDYTLFERLK